MTARKPIVRAGGANRQMPAGDTLLGYARYYESETAPPGTRAEGDVWTKTDTNKTYRWSVDAGGWIAWGLRAGTPFVTLADQAGAVTLPVTGVAASVSALLQSVRNNIKQLFGQTREKLSAARTYYVRTDGNDSNTGLANTAAGAFRTIQKAVDIAASLDLGIYDAAILVGAGTWTSTTVLKTLVGAGKVVIKGAVSDTTSTIISTTGADGFTGSFVGKYHFEWLKIQTTTTGYCIYAQGGGAVVTWGNVNFGATAFMHVSGGSGAAFEAVGNYSISGGGLAHASSYDSATVRIIGVTVNLSGTPGFTQAFVAAERASSIVVANTTFSGAATGSRYRASSNGVVASGGAGETYLPGNTAGVKQTGGQYE